MITILTSAIRLFILLSYTTLLSKIMGMRNYRELSAVVKLTKPGTVSFARVQIGMNPFGESRHWDHSMSGAIRAT